MNGQAALADPPKVWRPIRMIQQLVAAESAGGLLLLFAAVAALVWANSPWGDSYQIFWHAKVGMTLAGATHAMSLEHWVNDGLMAIFFLFVGLEIKRELLQGELASIKKAALPVTAAIGGMVVPAGIYAVLNVGKPGAAGWGIAMATDIAFAMAVVAMVGRSLPLSVKVFLLAVAIVDDLGAVLVIAVFYTSSVSWVALAIAGGFLAALFIFNRF
jgi:NhaA family Na+:H+ antiporter